MVLYKNWVKNLIITILWVSACVLNPICSPLSTHARLHYSNLQMLSTWIGFHQITRDDVDHFRKGQWIPECQLIVQWERKDEKPVELRHKVDLTGAKPPYNFIHLILDPAEQGIYICGSKIWPVLLVYILHSYTWCMLDTRTKYWRSTLVVEL